MNARHLLLLTLVVGSGMLCAADAPQAGQNPLTQATDTVQQRLDAAVKELNRLREQVAAEKVPLSRRLSDLESELVNVRLDYQKTTRLLDSRTLDLTNLRSEIKARQQESAYLSNLLGEYVRNFESRLHIAEIQRYRGALEAAKLAPENSNLSEQEVYQAQCSLLEVALRRFEDALGGDRFEGTAVDPSGLVKQGDFVLMGPVAIFKSRDGQVVGTVEQRLGSLEPSVVPFVSPPDAAAAANLVSASSGVLPLDPSLGNAHKIEQTKETWVEHIKKGGPVMYPIFALAGAALIVALIKWTTLLFIRTPSQRRITALLKAVAAHDEKAAQKNVRAIRGPVGRVLAAGVAHLREPRDLVEEVMYEKILATRLKLERFLPFIAISASSAPLLGLLGTVTGIINTFKLITVFGSGDVKTLSGGISEALITTEYGLIVAIPSLLIHAFLSRRARSVVNQMEKAAIALINQISKKPFNSNNDVKSPHGLTPAQYQSLLGSIHVQTQSADPGQTGRYSRDSAGDVMSPRLVSISKGATVAEAINEVRTSEAGNDIDMVYVVDEKGRFFGHVRVRQLLTRPEQAPIELLADTEPFFVRIDAHQNEIRSFFHKHDLPSLAVVDYEGRLVGQISRNGNGDGK